jgi:hypothetical protein
MTLAIATVKKQAWRWKNQQYKNWGQVIQLISSDRALADACNQGKLHLKGKENGVQKERVMIIRYNI